MQGIRGRDGWNLGLLALVLGVAFLAAAWTFADPDLWGHVRFGQLILSGDGVSRSDPFSYLTEGQRWVNHEWLAEVLFAWSYDLAGPGGLVALKTVLVIGIVLLAVRHLSRRGLDMLRAGIVVVVMVALMRIGIATVRPHLFTYLLFFAVLLVLEGAERGGGKWLWTLPVVFAAWVNLHGGFLAGLGVLAVWVGARVAHQRWGHRSSRGMSGTDSARVSSAWLWGVLAASVAATLINPYGPELLVFLGRTAIVPRPEITEWQPIDIRSVPGLWYLVFLAALAAALIRADRPKRPGAMVVLAITAIVPLLAIRHLPLFALAGVVMGGEHLAGVFGRRPPAGRTPRRSGLVWRTMPVLASLAGLGLVLAGLPRFRCIELEKGEYPVRAVRLLEESDAAGNLAVFFNWGEYAIWHLAPRLLVSMDGRRETVYPDSIYSEHLRFVRGTGDWDDLLERRPTDVALVERGGPTYNLLSLKPGWRLAHSDSVAGVFAREGWGDSSLLPPRESSPDTVAEAAGCFP